MNAKSTPSTGRNTRLASLTLLGLLAAAPFTAAVAASDTPPNPEDAFDRDAFYRRTMAAAAERAQADLMQSTLLWEDHSTWEDPWRVQTQHYEVAIAGSRLAGLELAHGLETMLGHFQDVTGFELATKGRFIINVFPDIDRYNAFGESAGAEHSSFYASFFAPADLAQPVSTFATSSMGRQLIWTTHGATHQFLASVGSAQVPAWIDEGLASFFSLYWSYAWGVAELRLIFASGTFVPFSQLLTDSISDFTDRPEARLIELGMLFNYLLLFRPDTRTVLDEDGEVVSAPFLEYLRGRLRGQDMGGHPVHALLTTGLGGLERDFRMFDGWD